ncbi:hypothetical protein Calag_0839 [Caldisphaera lagunensis DSM 15908]|uniref:Uncharacterized protein n=2 Tax=Caldisphaera lagunensis TaxID=200415 RepID=L0AC08_CALLD|nr:hypothetical protein Calag_0839 [Caldisphaera lagunensis DSM 15908]
MAHGLMSSMILSLALAIGLARKISIFVPLVLINGIIDIYAFNYLRLKVTKLNLKDLILLVILFIPYIIMLKLNNFYLIMPISLLILYLIFSFKKKFVLSNIIGSTFIASLSLIWLLMISNINVEQFLIILSWIIFTLTLSVIVEYKLPFRKIDKVSTIGYPLIIISLGIAITYLLGYYDLILLYTFPISALILSGEKLRNVKEIKKIGKIGMYSSLSFILIGIMLYNLFLTPINLNIIFIN